MNRRTGFRFQIRALKFGARGGTWTPTPLGTCTSNMRGYHYTTRATLGSWEQEVLPFYTRPSKPSITSPYWSNKRHLKLSLAYVNPPRGAANLTLWEPRMARKNRKGGQGRLRYRFINIHGSEKGETDGWNERSLNVLPDVLRSYNGSTCLYARSSNA